MKNNLFNVNNLLNNEREKWATFPHSRSAARWNWIADPSTAREKPLLCNETCCFANEVCQNSNLHGLKYVGNVPGRYFERAFFAIFFILGILASVYLILEALKKYREFPTFVTFRENDIKIDHIPFPSITICTINNVSKKKAMPIVEEGKRTYPKLSPQTFEDLQFLDHLCESTATSFSSKYNPEDEEQAQNLLDDLFPVIGDDDIPDDKYVPQDPYELEQKIFDHTQSCEDMIKLCLWQNKPVNCTELFFATLTDYGKCCTFNMAPVSLLFYNEKTQNTMLPELVDEWKEADLRMERLVTGRHVKKVAQPKRVKRSGLYHGLSILLDPAIDDYFCPASDSLGFQLATHVPVEFPQIADFGEAIAPNTENFIKVSPDVTTADEEIRSLNPVDRNCYFAGEMNLTYFTEYTQRNCLDECWADVLFQLCECTRFYMPKDDNRRLCGHEGLECINAIQSSLVSNKWSIKDYCKSCRPTCTDIKYEIEVTSRFMREDINVWAGIDGDMDHWNSSQLAIVHIYFAEDSTYPKIRKRLFGVIDIIANIGGLLGLCLGFSILSAVELVYLLLVRVFGKSCVVTKMLVKRKLNNEYRMQNAVKPNQNQDKGNPGGARRKIMRNASRRIITTQPLSLSSSPAAYHKATVKNVLPNYFLDEVAPRFATGNNLRYY